MNAEPPTQRVFKWSIDRGNPVIVNVIRLTELSIVPEFETLAESIVASRGADTIVHASFCPEHRVFLPEELDDFVSRLGLDGPGDDWREVSRADSLVLLSRILERDLAYDIQLMDASLAAKLANQFTDFFSPESRYFTNGTFHTDSPEFMPTTDYSYDTGVVAINRTQIGILWVRDNS